ncbi:MAG TPA: hypothetical protein VK369_05765, partial [Segetibacter sp.]|nr:hypothetical protein [Segetibacter sp.]
PLVSMGGSSYLFTCASIGIILSVARNVEQIEGMTLSTVPEEETSKPGNETDEPVKKRKVEKEVIREVGV